MATETELNQAMRAAKEVLDGASMDVAVVADRYFSSSKGPKNDKAQAELMRTLLANLSRWRQAKAAYDKAYDNWDSMSARTQLDLERPGRTDSLADRTMPGNTLPGLDLTDPAISKKR